MIVRVCLALVHDCKHPPFNGGRGKVCRLRLNTRGLQWEVARGGTVMTPITSPRNPRVKRVARLQRSARERRRAGVVVVEGCYEIEVALSSGLKPLEVYFCPELAGERTVKGLEERPWVVSREAFERMSRREGPDGWLALFPRPQRRLADLRLRSPALVVLVEAVEKPGNLGAILRTADAAGVDAVVVADPGVDLYNPNVVRASRGTLFTVPTVAVPGEEALRWLREHHLRLLAATPHAALAYTQVDFRGSVCIAVGREDTGLSERWLREADVQVRIPMWGRVNSLNVSVAAALLIYEVRRHQPLSHTP